MLTICNPKHSSISLNEEKFSLSLLNNVINEREVHMFNIHMRVYVHKCMYIYVEMKKGLFERENFK